MGNSVKILNIHVHLNSFIPFIIRCNGAEDLSPAWKYFNKNGAVTGSNYSEHAGCKPYPFLPSKEANEDYHTPQCEKNCTNEKYGRNYENDKIMG
jgi:hypothetical protein